MKLDNQIRGVTLIELLVAVAVIAILVGLLIPVSSSIRISAKAAKSTGNLRTISSAIGLYVAENNGALPDGCYRPKLNGEKVGYWFNLLDYYCGGKDWTPEGQKNPVRPEWQNDPLKLYPAPVFDPSGYAVNVGYGWNFSYLGYAEGSPSSYGWKTKINNIPKPAETIIVGTNKDDPTLASAPFLYAQKESLPKRYRGKGIYLFVDGHTEALTPEQAAIDNSNLFRREKLQ